MLKDCLYIIGLAYRDLSHERVLSLCMACSLGAIFTPIVILLGLQQGIIGNMLDKLDSDPASRLVRPKFMLQSPLPQEAMGIIEDAGAEFIPSETSHLLLDVKGLPDPVNAVPSSESDPFFIHANVTAMENNTRWIVISELLSKRLGKYKQDTLTIMLRRSTRVSYHEEVPMDFKIVGVLSTDIMPDMKMYLPVKTFDGIYHWRKGYAVLALNLKGNRRSHFVPEYDGVITTFTTKNPKEEDIRKMLAGRFPFSSMPASYGEKISNGSSFSSLLWETINSTITTKEIEVLRNALLNYGYKPELTPYVRSIDLELHHESIAKMWRLRLLSESLSPEWRVTEPPILFIPCEDSEISGVQNLILKTGAERKPVTIPVTLIASENVPSGHITASHHFAGLLRFATRAGASYDSAKSAFTLDNKEMVRYFRVYSPSLDQLETLVQTVKRIGDKLGINALREPVSSLYEVRKIRTLSDYMKRIYLLIAVISGASTIFAVSASVYATVQRRRKDLAYLNMLGVDKSTILFFPFIKSMMLIILGLFIAFSAYWLFGILASHWFVDLLGETESLTRLKASNALLLTAIILSLGGLSSLLAGRVISKIDAKRYVHE